jgi:hypothetical protein
MISISRAADPSVIRKGQWGVVDGVLWVACPMCAVQSIIYKEMVVGDEVLDWSCFSCHFHDSLKLEDFA